MPDKKADEKQEEKVTEGIEEEVQEVTPPAPIVEVIEPHLEKPAWLIALENSINGRFDSLDERLEKVEKGKSQNAETLHTGGTGSEETKGGTKETNGGGEPKPAGDSQTPPAKRKPRARLWRTI